MPWEKKSLWPMCPAQPAKVCRLMTCFGSCLMGFGPSKARKSLRDLGFFKLPRHLYHTPLLSVT